MAHVYGHRRRSEIGPWMRNLWDKLPDFNLGGLSPSYGQFAPQTEAEYEVQRNRSMWTTPGADPMQDVIGQIQASGALPTSQYKSGAPVGGWPGRAAYGDLAAPARLGGQAAYMGEKPGPDVPESWEPSIGYDVSKPVEEEDDMTKLLRYMFMSELMAGIGGDPPPTPVKITAGPAARAFPTMPSM